MYSAFMQFNEVFVTGGTGLLGRYVCRALIGHGFLPRLLVRTGSEERIAPDVRERCRVTPGDLTVREGVEMGAQGTSAIVHLAGVWKEQPRRGITFEEAHVHATANVLYSASVWGIGRLIFVGVAGDAPGTRFRTSMPGGERRRWCGGRIFRGPCSAPLPGTISAMEKCWSPRNT
jgi:Nucleoside-diphosphate-sugar epimerases